MIAGRAVVACTLCALSCAHAKRSDGPLEVIAVAGDATSSVPDVKQHLRAVLEERTPNVRIEDASEAWDALDPDRLARADPETRYLDELAHDWAVKYGEAKGFASTELLAAVLWNAYLDRAKARASLTATFQRGRVVVRLVRAGAPEECRAVAEPDPRQLVQTIEALARRCLAGTGERYDRIADTTLVMPAKGSAPPGERTVAPPAPDVPVDPRLETVATAQFMARLELPCAARTSLKVDGRAAPAFSKLLEQRWQQAALPAAEPSPVTCLLTGKSEIQRPALAGVLPFRVNTYSLACGSTTASSKVVVEGDLWPEQVTRKLLAELDAKLCAPK